MPKPNPKVILLSLLGILFLYLTFTLSAYFIIGAALTSFFAWKILS
jgi:hypothetical protein